MRIAVSIKYLGVAALALGMAAGCASTQQTQAAAVDETCEGTSPEVQAAIQQAQSAINEAFTAGAEWRDAHDLLQQAKAAGEECRDMKAMSLARQAEAMAVASTDAYSAEQAQAEPVQTESADRSYTVSRGDTLWGISASPVGYNNPYMWPLIYRANTDVIRDPDLIYPGETLTIEADPSASAANAAVNHAKTRGEWSLGVVEQSDERYLANW